METCLACRRAHSQLPFLQGLLVVAAVLFFHVPRSKARSCVQALLAVAGQSLHLFSATTGHSQWSVTQQKYRSSTFGADAVFWKDDAKSESFDVVSLSEGTTVRRIDGRTGDVKWTWTAESSLLSSVPRSLPKKYKLTVCNVQAGNSAFRDRSIHTLRP
jgi:hypothetical protein